MILAKQRQYRRGLALVCAVAVLVVLALHIFTPRYQRLELRVRDQLAIFGRRAPVHPDLVFLAIDNASATLNDLHEGNLAESEALQKMKATGYPYPRDVYPLILERLVAAGAKVVAFDIMFPAERELDPPFRAALEKYADKVVIGGNLEARDQAAIADENARFRHAWVPPAETLIPPLAEGSDSRVGFVNFWPDEEDLVVRHAQFRTTSEALEGLPVADDAKVFSSLFARILDKSGRSELVPPGYQPVMMRFAQNVRPISLYLLFVEEVWKKPPFNSGEFFRDKIVFIGPDGNWVKDELLTPFGLTNGPRLHLSALNAALTGEFLRATPPWLNLMLIFAGGGVAWLLGRFIQRPGHRLLALVACLVGIYGIAQLAFNVWGWYPLLFSPLLALAASGGTFSVVEQILERREKRQLRQTFERYVSRDVVRELVDNPQSFLNALDGVRKKITILFSDVRGFTTLTESADPHALVKQLNEYFNAMVREVFAKQGTLDKFIGDAVMAHWGSIETKGEKIDAQRAVATALQMRRSLAALNASWRERGIRELRIGIGVNHGDAIVGNIGAEERREVGVIGDTVNVASRLEGATKLYGLDLCIGEEVAALVRDSFVLRSVDLIVVRGKTRPVEVFGVLDERTPDVAEPAWLAQHEAALRLYRAGHFTNARQAWQNVLDIKPDDELAAVFIARCFELEKTPPQTKWGGVFEMKSK